jgi:hypothetical protein
VTGCIATLQRALIGFLIGVAPGRSHGCPHNNRRNLLLWIEAEPDPVKDDVLRWRCVDLHAGVDEEFTVRQHERMIGEYQATHGFRRLSVRPEPAKTDPAAQQAFKKLYSPRS